MTVNEDQIYKKMLDNMYEGIYFVDVNRKITFWNKGAERITGFLASEVVDKHCFHNILNHVDQDGTKMCYMGCPLHETIQDGLMREKHVYLHHKEGHRLAIRVRATPIYDQGTIVGAVEMFIGEEDSFHTQYHIEELKQLAFRDALTDLPNRRFLESQMHLAQDAYTSKSGNFAIAMVDIDFFKRVNDQYGHAVGDDVLKMTSKSMLAGIKKTDLLGRWGGEEFLCVFYNLEAPSLKAISERLRMLVESSGVRLENEEIKVTISIGATLYRTGDSLEETLERADQLLYQSKQNGRNRCSVSE